MAFSNYTASKGGDSDLCKLVVKRLGEDNISESLRNELIQVNGELAEATVQYFKYQLIVDCVKKFLNQKVGRKLKDKEQGILSDSFYLTYVKKYSFADGIKAFDISEDFIDKTINKNKKTQEEKEELNKFVENEIDNFCIKITQYAGYAQRYRNNQKKAFQEAIKDLTSQFDDLAITKCKLESQEKELNDLLTNYFENLVQGVSMLKSLVSLHGETIKFQSSLEKLYDSRQSTLTSKINRFEHEVLVATYHNKSVQALTIIREELNEKKVAVDNDLNSTNSELQAYSVLGPEYEKLVDEYSELLRKILNQKWAIESLKGRQSFGGSLSDKSLGGCLSDKEDLMASFGQEEKETSCSQMVKMSDCSVFSETSDISMIAEAVDNSRSEEIEDNSIFKQNMDSSIKE